jgi:hypothetical protein
MQDARVYLGLVRERGKKGLPLTRVYRQLYNRDLYLIAYGKIYRNAGATTQGTTEETVDAMSLTKIDAIINALRQEHYQWKPVRRVSIPKRKTPTSQSDLLSSEQYYPSKTEAGENGRSEVAGKAAASTSICRYC